MNGTLWDLNSDLAWPVAFQPASFGFEYDWYSILFVNILMDDEGASYFVLECDGIPLTTDNKGFGNH